MKKDSVRKLRWGGRVLLGIYLACLIYFMFFSESYGRTELHREYQYNLVLFREIRRFLVYRDILGPMAVCINIFGNVAVFVPFGFALPLLFQRIHGFLQVMILSFATSLLAETMQLISKVGCFDVDDLFLNTLGGCVGFLLYACFLKCLRKREKHENTNL